MECITGKKIEDRKGEGDQKQLSRIRPCPTIISNSLQEVVGPLAMLGWFNRQKKYKQKKNSNKESNISADFLSCSRTPLN